MDLSLTGLIDIFLHVDKYLGAILLEYQAWTYGILFLVIFCETGLVVTPFLPGDSLLFAAGALTATTGALDLPVLLIVIFVAAVIGDSVNYSVGNYIGPRVFQIDNKLLKKEYLIKAHEFYEKHGGKTIIIARFIPIIRTFAPFVAGVGSMTYGKFFTYNVVGGAVWTLLFVLAGYFFGELDFIKNNFSVVIIAIIVISVLPGVVGYAKAKLSAKKQTV